MRLNMIPTLISSSSRKNLLAQISLLPSVVLGLTPLLPLLVPVGTKLARVTTHLGHSLFLYTSPDGDPIWLWLDRGHGPLVPTVYTLAKCPLLLPVVETGRVVLEKLARGADLMIPGLSQLQLENLAPYPKHTLVAIAGLENDTSSGSQGALWGVGLLAEQGTVLRGSQSGKAVLTIHTRDDFLWRAGSQKLASPLALPDPPSEPPMDTKQDPPCPVVQPHSSHPPPKVENEQPPRSPPAATAKLSSEEVDQMLVTALLLGLSRMGSQPNLPMPGSLLYSSHVLPFRPANLADVKSSVGVKESSSKTLAKWLRLMQKKGYIGLKEDRGKGAAEPTVISLELSHPDVMAIDQYPTLADNEKVIHGNAAQHAQGGDHKVEADASPKIGSLTTLSEWFKPGKTLKGMKWIEEVDLDLQELYTRQALRKMILDYVQVQSNEQPNQRGQNNRKLIKPSESLLEALALSGDSTSMQDQRFSREEILELLLKSRFEPWWRLERSGKILVEKKGQVPFVAINVKKRAKSKVVTLITGVEIFGIDPGVLAKKLRTLCAVSTTTHVAKSEMVSQLPKTLLHAGVGFGHSAGVSNAPSGGVGGGFLEVECQGDQKRLVVQYLVDHYGVPKQWVKEPA